MTPTDYASPADHASVADLLARYCDGLYRCDVDLLSGVFHPSARYVTPSDGDLLELDMPTYLPRVGERTPPAETGESSAYSIDSIQFAGPLAATARLRCELFGKRYIDLLTLVKSDGRWSVISKVFHQEPARAVAS